MMTDGDIIKTLDEEISRAEDYIDGDILRDREIALNYYLRRDDGSEEEGRSQTHAATVYKTVEGLTTAISNIFLSEKQAIEFVAKKADSEKQAKERTSLVNYITYSKNQGFISILEAIKNGLLYKTGYLTWRVEKRKDITMETYRNQTQESMQMLSQHGDIVSATAAPPFQSPEGDIPLFDVVISLQKDETKHIIESIPVEEVIVSSNTRRCNISEAPFVAWRRKRSLLDLINEGYDEEEIKKHSESNGETWSLTRESDGFDDDDLYSVYTCWMRLDVDEDGIQELRKITKIGNAIIENIITDEVNISAWTPVIMPNEFVGRCPADDLIQTQREETAVRRQTMDSLYLANNPMMRVDASDPRVNYDDFLDYKIGKPVRAPAGAIEPLSMPFVGQQSFPIIEYLNSDSENITGWTRYAQGTDASSLNATATGISIITNMTQERIKLYARSFGEMCLAPAMRGVAKGLSQHCDKAFMFKVAGAYTEIDPRDWDNEFDVACNVGLGVTDKQQQSAYLGQIASAQAQAISAGALGKLLTLKNVYNTQIKIAENAGFADSSQFWLDPESVPPEQPQPPQPDPAVVKAQMDAQIKREQMQMDAENESNKLRANMQIKQFEATIKSQTDLQLEQIRSQGQYQMSEAMTRPQTSINLNAEQALGDMVSQLHQVVSSNQQALADGLSQIGQGLLSLAQAQAQATQVAAAPKRAVLSSGKTITIGTVNG